jgi:hypothetical protein
MYFRTVQLLTNDYMGMNVEECSRGICEGIIPVFLWEGLRKTTKTLRIVVVPTGIRICKCKGKSIPVLN